MSCSSLLALLACASTPASPPDAPGAADLLYAVTFEPDQGALHVLLRLGPRAAGRPLHFHARGRPYAENLKRRKDTVTYRYRLDDALSALEGAFGAERRGAIRVLSPTFWLLRPVDPSNLTYAIEAKTPDGFDFAHGYAPEDRASVLFSPAMAIFGPVAVHRVGGLRIVISPGRYAVPDERVLEWADASEAGVFDYFEEAPSEDALVLLLPCDGRAGPHGGFALGYKGGASIKVHLGWADDEVLARDWSLTHELLHLAFPNLPDHAWLEEGLATYVEPLIRARHGLLSEQQYWTELTHGMRNALDEQGQMGFTRPLSWGDVYWGGALFLLRCDIAIRTRTAGARSIDDALRAIHRRAGDIRSTLPAAEALRIGDAATGGDELTTLYRRLTRSRETFDLGALFAHLGVERTARGVSLDDDAPGAPIRRAFLRHAVSTRLAPKDGVASDVSRPSAPPSPTPSSP